MPSDVMEHAGNIVRILSEYEKFLVAAHGSPDGDAMGSTGTMGHILKAMGKEVILYNGTGMPKHLDFLPMGGPLRDHLRHLPFKPQVVIALDCGDAWRLGNELADALPKYKSINIDHHKGNPAYGTLYNWIDPDMAATGQMIAAVADAAGIPLTGDVAACIYVSLVADTGSFTHGNTSAEVLRLAARLLGSGLEAASLRDRMDNQWSLNKARLWGALLQKLRLEKNGQVCVCQISLADLGSAGAGKDDLEGFVEQMRRLRGVRVAMTLREDNPKRCKLSLRSSGADDVRDMAASFGGGGHVNAAGATLDMNLEQALEKCLISLDKVLMKN